VHAVVWGGLVILVVTVAAFVWLFVLGTGSHSLDVVVDLRMGPATPVVEGLLTG
jgi:hypothetical protein